MLLEELSNAMFLCPVIGIGEGASVSFVLYKKRSDGVSIEALKDILVGRRILGVEVSKEEQRASLLTSKGVVNFDVWVNKA